MFFYKQKPSLYNINTPKNTSRYHQIYDTRTPRQKSHKIDKQKFFRNKEYEKDYSVSTEGSHRRNRACNESQTSRNITNRIFEDYTDEDLYFDNEQSRRIEHQKTNNSLLSAYKKAPASFQIFHGQRNPNIQKSTHSQSHLEDQILFNFKKKISLLDLQKVTDIEIQQNKQKIKKKYLMSSQAISSSHTNDLSFSQKASAYDSLQRFHNVPMFLQMKQYYGQKLLKSQFNNKIQKQQNQLCLKDFTLGKSCGKGMYGKVFLARLKSNGTIYALKKISKQIVRKNNMQSQLALEIKLQLFFDHPHILKLYHFFDDEKYVYLIMEYMEEGSLFTKMQTMDFKMSEKQTALIITQISDAVNYLHDRDIVHRDIKPENIVISNGLHKLCDFGWATICKDRRSTYCGTFDYAAPEILRGKEYDQKVDLWCLGVLTYQLLIRKLPFYDVSRVLSIRKIVNSNIQAPVFPQSLSIKSKHFIECLMKNNPQQRLLAQNICSHPFINQYFVRRSSFY